MKIDKLYIYKKANIQYLSKEIYPEYHNTFYYVIYDIGINKEDYDIIYVKNVDNGCYINKNKIVENYDFYFYSPKNKTNEFIPINILVNLNNINKIQKMHSLDEWIVEDYFYIYKDCLIDKNIEIIVNNYYSICSEPIISIVMVHYNRIVQTCYTINTIIKSKIKDIEIIIVDDASKEIDINLLKTIINNFDISIKLICINNEYKIKKKYCNPCIPYNIGFHFISGKKCIIQNPECCHYMDLVKYVNDNLNINEYYTFSCFSLSQQNTHKLFKLEDKNLYDYVLENQYDRKFRNEWINHPIHRRSNYHFTSAINTEDLKKIGGFHEGFFEKIAFDDDEFLHRIITHGLEVKLIEFKRELPFVIHLYHDIVYNNMNIEPNVREYESLKSIINFNYISYRYL